MKKKILAIMLVLAISVVSQVAGAASLSLSAGTAGSSVGMSSDSDLLRDESLQETSVVSFGSGASVYKSSSGLLKSGSGSLSEHHWAENSEGDYAGVDANLSGSKSWSYRFSISASQDKVSAGQSLDISSGNGIDLSARSGNDRGDEAVVRVLGADDSVASMRCSNYAEATGQSASARQTVDGLTTSGSSVGYGSPLVIAGWACNVSDVQGQESDAPYCDQYAAVWTSVLGGSRASSSISVKSDSSGAYASQKLNAAKSEEISASAQSGSGHLSQSLPGDLYASVSSGAINCNSFGSKADASSTRSGASASQTVNARGDIVFKEMLAGLKGYDLDGSLAGYETMASGYTEVASGSLTSKDRAESSGNTAKVSEDLSARGTVFREIEASHMWQGDPSWRRAYSAVLADGSLSGRAQASYQPDVARINGKWVASCTEYYPERICMAENSTIGQGTWILGDLFYPFDESIISTEDVLDAH
jgi:hypothetical protein